MEKDWYDKYGKEFHCADCTFLDSCLKKDEPLYSRCCEQYLRDRIAELEAQLKNVIVPKFKIGQEVWFVDLVPLEIGNSNMDYIVIYENATYFALTNGFEFRDNMVFDTKEEAQAKLEELKGE